MVKTIIRRRNGEDMIQQQVLEFLRNTKITPEPSFWETDIEVVKGCGVLGQKVKVTVSHLFVTKVNFLMNKFDKMEWLAYLIGNKETNEITDIVIPQQRVTPVRVDVDGTVDVPIIGVIHSHHDMGNKFSHTDDEFINQNHDISLCISKRGINGHVRVKTECGRFALIEAEVVENIEGFDPILFGAVVDTLITEKSFGNRHNNLIDDINDTTIEEDLMVARAYDRGNGDLLLEISNYEDGIKHNVLDGDYINEMKLLSGYIKSIGTNDYDIWEEKVFNHDEGRVFTEDYFALIDEISASDGEISERSKVKLNRLAIKLDKVIETSSPVN